MNIYAVIAILLACHGLILAAFIGSAPRRDRGARHVMVMLLLVVSLLAAISAWGGQRFGPGTAGPVAVLTLWLFIPPLVYTYVRLRTGGARLRWADFLHLAPAVLAAGYGAVRMLTGDHGIWLGDTTAHGLLAGLYLVQAICYLAIARQRLTGPLWPLSSRDVLRGAARWWFRTLLTALLTFVLLDGAASAIVVVTGAGGATWHMAAVAVVSLIVFSLCYALLFEPSGLVVSRSGGRPRPYRTEPQPLAAPPRPTNHDRLSA